MKADDERIEKFREKTERENNKKMMLSFIREENKSMMLREYNNKINFLNSLKIEQNENKEKNRALKLREKHEDVENQMKIEKILKLKKDKMKSNFNKILNKNKRISNEEAYKMIFSPEDLEILNCSERNKSANGLGKCNKNK